MKKLSNPLELKVVFEVDDTGEVDIALSAHYSRECEYGSLGKKGIELELSSTEITQIKQFTKNVVLPKIKEHEGIV